MMRVLLLGLVLRMCCSAYSYSFSSSTDPELEWEEMEKVIADEKTQAFAPKTKSSHSGSESLQPAARRVPEYLRVPASKDQKKLFAPEKGARPLPASVKEMLLATAPPTTAPIRQRMIEMLCYLDRIYVRIRRDIFSSRLAYKQLTFGTCPVNQGTTEHYYFLYLLKTDCGFQIKSTENSLNIFNVLHYKPPTSPVVRALPFDVPLQCSYHRIFHSHAVGFYPKLQAGTVMKLLKSSTVVTLVPKDASGKDITGTKSYIMGQPMYFEATLADTASQLPENRIYINKCFMTASQDANSPHTYTVIDNHGCMIDGKMTDQSRFLPHASKMTQKLRVGAFVFKDMVSSAAPKQLYMHCEITVGNASPTRTLKACNYESATRKWTELYGSDSLCKCCEIRNSCSSAQPKSSRNSSPPTTQEDEDGSVEANPVFTMDAQEHKDFLKHWEHDY